MNNLYLNSKEWFGSCNKYLLNNTSLIFEISVKVYDYDWDAEWIIDGPELYLRWVYYGNFPCLKNADWYEGQAFPYQKTGFVKKINVE